MSDNKFKNKYRILSARAMWHHYGGGAYFITACTKKHAHYFGEIVHIANPSVATQQQQNSAIMQLTPVGQFLNDQIINIKTHYPYAEIPLFVIMPDHFHMIIFIDADEIPYQRRDVTQCGDPDLIKTQHEIQQNNANSETKNKVMQVTANSQGWLSVVIGGIKSAVTKFANKNGIEFVWQSHFDDHIIRDQDEMNRIAEYIENNPARWVDDSFNGNS